MFKNYLTTALRNILRQKTTTLINIGGLTLGVTSSLILFLLVNFHSGFDTYHSKKDRIYRLVTESDGNNNGKAHTPGVPTVLPEAFQNDFPEAEEVTFIAYRSGSLITIPVSNGDAKKFQEERGVTYAQPSFFKIFDRTLLIGDATKGLDEPNEAIISRQSANKYFGRTDAVGEILNYDGRDFRVTAIMEDFPANTDFPFDVLLSHITIKKELDEHGWGSIWSDETCYFLLKENSSVAEIEKRIPAFVEKYMGKENWDHRTYLIQPLSEIHFDDRFTNYNYNTIEKGVLLALGIIGAFLILTACINFINLSTAEAIKRSKEVGIRKSLGGTRYQLVFQFLGETTIVTIFSVLLSLGLVQLALGFINPFLELSLSLQFSDTALWLYLISVTVVVSLLSGLYPSLVVSAYNPVLALKNLISNRSSSGYTLRKGLVVMQFFISQFFIIGTIVLISQMNYFQSKDLGFRKDAILTVPIPSLEDAEKSKTAMRTLRDEITKLSEVEKASLCNTPPSSSSTSGTNFKLEGSTDNFNTQIKTVDGNYIDLFGLTLVAGKGLADQDTATSFVVNERLARMVGFQNPADIVGKEITMWQKTLRVSGVVKDFHTVSLHRPIEATVLLNRSKNYGNLSVRVNPQNLQAAIDAIKEKWEATYPENIFSYEFLDQSIKEFYEGERKTSILLTLFTSMAIFIGCLGLFGLATFMANQKSKEIGVRKVLGASVESIMLQFSREYIQLIVIGFLLAAPLAWIVMNKMLDEFAYKIEIGPLVFIMGIVITLSIALITVGYRSFKAATINPAHALRSE